MSICSAFRGGNSPLLRRWLDDALPYGARDRLGTVLYLKLPEDPGTVVLDRFRAQEQLVGDLFASAPLADKLQDLPLSTCERIA